MIKEDYISFETAKLLKEKGFDEFCNAYYEDYGRKQSLCIPIKRKGISNQDFKQRDNYNRRFNLPEENYKCVAPTQQMAMRWLREVHNLFIEIKYATSLFHQPHTTIYFQICYMSLDYNTSGKDMLPDDYIREYYTSYEQACEAAIKYCLENLI